MSLLHPCDVGLVMGPGTASTARPCSSAASAVMIAPEFTAASITTVTPARPEMRRLRRGNVWACGRSPGGGSRSGERRVGEEGRSRGSPYHLKKKTKNRHARVIHVR